MVFRPILCCVVLPKYTARCKKEEALFCNVREDSVIPALDVESIYEVPMSYHREGLDVQVLKHFKMDEDAQKPVNLSRWERIIKVLKTPEGEVNIAVVGKYTNLLDAYKSLNEALMHGGIANKVRVKLNWLESEIFETTDPVHSLENCDGILVPGGFGERGAEGKIAVAKFARERRVPYFGICFGMQLAVIEAARNLAGIEGANSSEFGPTENAVIGLMTEWNRAGTIERRDDDSDLGGTMRLGAYLAGWFQN